MRKKVILSVYADSNKASFMKKVVVIVAGGSGSRMKSELPKQFIELNGKPILMHTIERFYNFDSAMDIRIVLPLDQISFWEEMLPYYNFNITCKVYAGGNSRFQSVKNGLKDISNDTLVAIHDGVRPFVNELTIESGFKVAEEKGSAIPVISVFETIRRLDEADRSQTVNRDKYKLVQTPQIFNSDILLEAYSQDFSEEFTDDASVVEAKGYAINLFEGNRENIKITTQVDLLVAKAYLGISN